MPIKFCCHGYDLVYSHAARWALQGSEYGTLVGCQIRMVCCNLQTRGISDAQPVICYFLCIDPLTFFESDLSKSNPKHMYKLNPQRASSHRRNDDGTFD